MKVCPLVVLWLLCTAAVVGAYDVLTELTEDSVDTFAGSTEILELVNAPQDLLTVLTPVFPDPHTLSLLRNQLRTFAAFVDVESFAAWVLVAPGEQLPALQAFLDAELQELPPALDKLVRVVADEVCAPELEPRRFASLAFNDAAFVNGWLKQQLLKLACAHLIRTPYYLITDADTLFLNAFSAVDLVEQGTCEGRRHAVCDRGRTRSYRARSETHEYINGTQPHGNGLWVHSSAATLQLPRPGAGVRRSIGVTPQILSRPLVAALARHLDHLLAEEVWERVTWRAYLVSRLTDYFSLPKDEQLRGNTPWTEYNLYWVFAVHAGLWDRYHVHGQLQSVAANAWHSDDFNSWDPCASNAVDEWNPGLWGTVQSVVEIRGARNCGHAWGQKRWR